MLNQCLLIKAKGGKKFLTPKENLASLTEFAKTFGAEIYLVEPNKGQKTLGLRALTNAFCNPQYEDEPEYTEIEKIFPNTRNRQEILEESEKIKWYIIQKLLSGKPVSLKDLKKKYADTGLTDACLCNHFKKARLEISKEESHFDKIGAGAYKINQEICGKLPSEIPHYANQKVI